MRHTWTQFASISRLHIIAIAAMGTLTFGWLFVGQYLWLPVGLCALDWFLVNLLNRVVDLEEDKANAIAATGFVERHRRAILWLGFGLLTTSLVVTAFFYPLLTALRAAYHCLGFAYNWPLFPGKKRIKQLYFWKNTASAIGFLLTVFGYPLAYAGWWQAGFQAPAGISAATLWVTLGFFFLFELSYEVIYDLRDAPGDAAAEVASYPVVHGEAGARKIIDGLLLSSLVVLAAGYIVQVVPWRLFVMGVAPILQWQLYKWTLQRHHKIRAWDCIAITWLGAGLLACYHIWIWLELPGIGA